MKMLEKLARSLAARYVCQNCFEIDKSFYLAAKEKMLAGVQEAQKTAKDAGSQITIGEIAETTRQGGRPI